MSDILDNDAPALAAAVEARQKAARRMRQFYRDAVQLQNACNLSGVLHTLADALPYIRAEGPYGTTEINQHPIVQLIVSKMHDLAGMGLSDLDAFGRALTICEERGREPA